MTPDLVEIARTLTSTASEDEVLAFAGQLKQAQLLVDRRIMAPAPMTPNASERALTAEEAAQRLGLPSKKAVYDLVREGALRKVPGLGKRIVRIPESAVEAMLAGRRGGGR